MNQVLSLEAVDLHRYYQVGKGPFKQPATLKAVAGASFTLAPGKTLAVVGESGCGKSTLARLIAMIEPPTSGRLAIDGQDIVGATRSTLRSLRPKVQMVFQDPYGSLNPRKQVGSILEEPLEINTPLAADARRRAARDMMAKVGLRPEYYGRYPHMFSGGQRQRIAIARALMLDVSIRAQVLNLLMDLQAEFELAYLFISHDLGVVRHIADEVMVMYLGRTVEHGAKETIFAGPRHPYTRALLASTPAVDPAQRRQRAAIKGELPSPFDPPPGCAFHRRCPHATPLCASTVPELRALAGRLVACHHAEAIG
jgi:dipeptide transport system ATP-binding protein